jgi:hypothetical protein
VQQLDLPLIRRPGQGRAINILMEADMAHLMENRKGNLHWILQPNQTDTSHPSYGWIGCLRMVKPWHEWLCIVFPGPTADPSKNPSEEDYREMVRQFIGDDSISVQALGISTWNINEIAAEKYSQGNVLAIHYYFPLNAANYIYSFCLGDAVHRHPPNHGLGSNTCIQDAHNLAWKIFYALRGLQYSCFIICLHNIANPRVINRKSRKRAFGNLQYRAPTCRTRRDHAVRSLSVTHPCRERLLIPE